MSVFRFLKRAVAPLAPPAGQARIWISTDNKAKLTLDNGETKDFEGLFGEDFQIVERTDEQTTTSKNWQTYLNSNINGVDKNNLYRLNINFFWGYSSAANDMEARILVNGTQYGETFKVEPKDGGSDQRISSNILAYLSVARFPDFNDSNQVQFQFRSSTNGNEARIYSALQEFWRVA